jgi:membrane-associated phospholipid phosphatase
MVTVLPNPQQHCYVRNFPPVPDSLSEYVAIGFGAKRGHGCNDLVISGHGVVYAVCALGIQTYCAKRWCGFLAWLGVLKLCFQEVVDKTHYSVDMFLAVVVTALVWEWRKTVYDETGRKAHVEIAQH